jgi:hypothetical protein
MATISELRPFQDCEVTLHLKDGEVLRAEIDFVDLEYQDIIVTVLDTNQPEHYLDSNACYTIPVIDIVSVRDSKEPTTSSP